MLLCYARAQRPQPIFDVESRQLSRAVVIAHVSPHIQDSVHSVSTLSYAAPFKTAPPKPRGPAPYDAADPRTWTHEHARAWFAENFLEHARERASDPFGLFPYVRRIFAPELVRVCRRVDAHRRLVLFW